MSRKAENILEVQGEKELGEAQAEFLGRVAPLHFVKGVKTKSGRAEKPPKISTVDQTAELIRAKKNLNEMMKARDMVADTIIGHIEDLADSGLDISYLKYDISPQHWDKIAKALEEVSLQQKDDKPPFLSPVKSKVGPNISFKEIRLARVLLGYVKKQK